MLRIRRSGFAPQQRIDQRAVQIVEAAAIWSQRNGNLIPFSDQECGKRFLHCLHSAGNPLEHKAAVLQFLSYLAPHIPEHHQQQQLAASASRIREFIELIHQQYADEFTVADALSITGLARSTFHQAFKQATGTTFNRYLTSVRITVAARKLLNTNDSILSIAFGCGFGSSSRFHDAFRREFGTAPERYRRQSGKQS